jgi:general secretion pathway protein D
MKRFAGWITVVVPVVTAVAWIAVAEDGSNLRRLLDSLDATSGQARPIQLAQADAAAPAPVPNLDELLGGTKPATPAPAPAPDTPAPMPEAPAPMPEAPAPAPAPAPETPAPEPAPAPDAPAPAPAPMPETPAPAPMPEPEAPAPAPAAPEAPAPAPMPEAPAPTPAPAAPPSDLEALLGTTMPAPAAPEAAPAAAPAEAMPAEAPSVEPAADPGAKPAVSAPQLEEQERVRRQADEKEGLMALATALEAMRKEDYQTAFDKFQVASSKIQVREATAEARRKAEAGRADAALKLAEAAVAARNPNEADKWLSEAEKTGGDVRRLKSRVASLRQDIIDDSQRTVRIKDQPSVTQKKATTADLVELGRQFFEVEEYDEAESAFEQALRNDPYNKDAMKFLRKIEERRLKISQLHRSATRVDMVQDVVDRWNPPLRTMSAAPPKQQKDDAKGTGTAQRLLQEKMQSIVIPTIEFRQANIVDVIGFLRDASEAVDTAGGGVNIILKLDVGASAAPAPMGGASVADPFAAAPADGAAPAPDPFAAAGGDMGGGGGGIPAITLNLRRVTLLDAIRYVTEVANLKYRIEENAVIITPANAVQGNVVTRLYPVQPSIVEIVTTRTATDASAQNRGEFITMGGASGVAMEQQRDMKKFFADMGVPFPTGTSISYNSTISQLIVRNTPENLEIFERILAALNVVPNQVEIEARFVEVAQGDLTELGVEWLLTDAWEIANQTGTGPMSARPRVQMNANSGVGGFTHGLRYFTSDAGSIAPASRSADNASTMAGTLMSISSILTNPEMTMILHALEQRGGTDLLSSPRVTTRSGVNAQIKVVEEIIYPTEYESQSVGDMIAGFGGGGIGGGVTQPTESRPPVPGSFETREVGVILNVTPTVGPDGYTIDLTLVPEVAEFVRWIDYGPNGLYPILQPVFASRNVTTSIVLWDGQTVVMGGLIRDQTTSIDDRIPLLGDLPLIGYLFRSTGQSSQKQNLVIFVTARLVDPAGNPIHAQKKARGAESKAENQQ